MDLNPSFNFESFVVGSSNESAAAAARVVAHTPGLVHNPLFLCGSAGQGKTHLLMALAQEALRKRPGLNARYVTVTEFAEAYDTAVAAGQQERFSRRLGELDLLLLDDVHVLGDRRDIADELCHLQDRLWSAGKQLVVTGDRAPDALTEFDERLISRFGSGLVVTLGPPNERMRLAILERSAATLGETFSDGVLEAVSQQPVRSVRDLLGGLARLVALGAAGRAPITPGEASRVFDDEEDAVRSDRGTGSTEMRAPVPETAEFDNFFLAVRTRITEAAGAWDARGARADEPTTADVVRSREKMIWTWPIAEDRLIEELF